MKKIVVHENFFDEILFSECLLLSNELFSLSSLERREKNFNTFNINICTWSYNVVLDSNPIYTYTLDDSSEIYRKILQTIRSKNILHTIKNICFYFYTQGSHVPWHNDLPYKGGLTIYLNELWDKNNGGLFLFEHENEIKALVPKRNNAIEQIGGVNHSVSPTTKNSDIRRTLQIFFK
jgi:hypothetical protein